MKQILAMSKTEPNCAIHGAPADGFSKVDNFSDFAELFSSAFFLPKTSFRVRPGISLRFYCRKMADQVRHDEAFN
ncbi:hypothetical protein [Fibrobacter sp. UBA4309]|uniref:hypothetical protein n=1 Tax=Fibrobacter sp. UBA4309 TaxID=1946537 RepID=UPI0025BC608B|nr:hypothetical protein [Fibrobacter sp. UBA4309]